MSAHHIGQVYVPLVNWALMIGCVGLVIGFRTSNLAAAYGIAVTTTKLITTLLFYRVARDRWAWSTGRALAVTLPLLVVDVGRQALANGVARVPGTAVYLSKNVGAAPAVLISNLAHNKVLHHETLLVAVEISDVPRVADADRLTVTRLAPGLHQVVVHVGFMDVPDVPRALDRLRIPGFEFDLEDTTFFLGRESVTSTGLPGMQPWREELFVVMNRSAASAARFFSLPADRVLEVGIQVEI